MNDCPITKYYLLCTILGREKNTDCLSILIFFIFFKDIPGGRTMIEVHPYAAYGDWTVLRTRCK